MEADVDTYSILRQFADSWGLLVMAVFFLGVILYNLRPGSKKMADDIAQIPFRNDKLSGE
jgi:cytochrome c oxidase cbb3-type subunit 4